MANSRAGLVHRTCEFSTLVNAETNVGIWGSTANLGRLEASSVVNSHLKYANGGIKWGSRKQLLQIESKYWKTFSNG